ncbi:hypothetical protein CBR_g66688 [Chara braunii]|uniref:F-box domain-containing protein n=1 Tax=Chara braunii TaxID=69332 RepID=A0A388JQ30_CHABU|nr:hypothetical protein CBR_g66688 [Chara braunii]|eukprot:GBG59881.1 hypothetical protein CBR_g66688 [Chara braunii]
MAYSRLDRLQEPVASSANGDCIVGDGAHVPVPSRRSLRCRSDAASGSISAPRGSFSGGGGAGGRTHAALATSGCSTTAAASRSYLRPGLLAQYADAHKNSRTSCMSNVSRKRVLGETTSSLYSKAAGTVVDIRGDRGGSGGDEGRGRERGAGLGAGGKELSVNRSLSLTPSPDVPPPRDLATMFIQRKKMVAPRTPRTPQAFTVYRDSTPEPAESSSLESLPTELLVRILCYLHHDELKPAFFVCKRLREATIAAVQIHFNYTTPDRDRQEILSFTTPNPSQRWPFRSGQHGCLPQVPQAPRPQRLVQHHSVSFPAATLRQVAASLFPCTPRPQQASVFYHLPSFPRPLRMASSHRVLFHKEDLCTVVAQESV